MSILQCTEFACLTSLLSMAVDTNTEIAGQNAQIDRINQKAAWLDSRITMANQRAIKLVGKSKKSSPAKEKNIKW